MALVQRPCLSWGKKRGAGSHKEGVVASLDLVANHKLEGGLYSTMTKDEVLHYKPRITHIVSHRSRLVFSGLQGRNKF